VLRTTDARESRRRDNYLGGRGGRTSVPSERVGGQGPVSCPFIPGGAGRRWPPHGVRRTPGTTAHPGCGCVWGGGWGDGCRSGVVKAHEFASFLFRRLWFRPPEDITTPPASWRTIPPVDRSLAVRNTTARKRPQISGT